MQKPGFTHFFLGSQDLLYFAPFLLMVFLIFNLCWVMLRSLDPGLWEHGSGFIHNKLSHQVQGSQLSFFCQMFISSARVSTCVFLQVHSETEIDSFSPSSFPQKYSYPLGPGISWSGSILKYYSSRTHVPTAQGHRIYQFPSINSLNINCIAERSGIKYSRP